MELSCSSDYLADAKVIKFLFLRVSGDLVQFPLLWRGCWICCDLVVRSCGLAIQVWSGLRGFLLDLVDSQAVGRFGDRLDRRWFLRGWVPGLRGGDRPMRAVFRFSPGRSGTFRIICIGADVRTGIPLIVTSGLCSIVIATDRPPAPNSNDQ